MLFSFIFQAYRPSSQTSATSLQRKATNRARNNLFCRFCLPKLSAYFPCIFLQCERQTSPNNGIQIFQLHNPVTHDDSLQAQPSCKCEQQKGSRKMNFLQLAALHPSSHQMKVIFRSSPAPGVAAQQRSANPGSLTK